MDLTVLQQELDELNQQYARIQWLRHEKERLQQELEQLQSERSVIQQARLLLLEAGKEARKSVKSLLESIVTRMLQAVYDETYRFEVEINEEGKEAQVHFYVCIGDEIREEPTEAMGGGVSDVITIALRIAYKVLCSPKIGGPLILDEPAKQLDKERTPLLGQILHDIAHEMGIQIIMITHDPGLAGWADRTHRIHLNNNVSNIEVL